MNSVQVGPVRSRVGLMPAERRIFHTVDAANLDERRNPDGTGHGCRRPTGERVDCPSRLAHGRLTHSPRLSASPGGRPRQDLSPNAGSGRTEPHLDVRHATEPIRHSVLLSLG
jgi:hypothetical protein